MKILVLNYEFPPIGGGASPVSYDLSKEYAAQGHTVDVVTMRYKDLPHVEKKDGMTIYRVLSVRQKKEVCEFHEMLSYILPALRKALELHKKNTYDICHCHFIIPTGVIAYILHKITGLPYVITIHGTDMPNHNTDRFLFWHKFSTPFIHKIAKNAKKIVCSSHHFAKITTKLLGIRPAIIPNGVHTDYFIPGKKKNIILSAGRLYKFKGFQDIIQAVSSKKTWPVHIAGDGPYRDELEKLAHNSKTPIVFHGWIDQTQLKKLYAEAKIFILASDRENASIALLEAMSSGCAVITTKSAGCPETVGKAGELYTFGNSKALREKIDKVTLNYTLKSKESLQKSKEYSIQKIARAYEQVLKNASK